MAHLLPPHALFLNPPPGLMLIGVYYLIPGPLAPPSSALQLPALSSTACSPAPSQPQSGAGLHPDMATSQGGQPSQLVARRARRRLISRAQSPTMSSGIGHYAAPPVKPAHLQPQSGVGHNAEIITRLGGHPYLLPALRAGQQRHSKPYLTPMSSTVTSSPSSVKPALSVASPSFGPQMPAMSFTCRSTSPKFQPQSGAGLNPATSSAVHLYQLAVLRARQQQQQLSKPHLPPYQPDASPTVTSSVKPGLVCPLQLKHIPRDTRWEQFCRIQEGNTVKYLASANCPLCGDVK